MNLISKHLLCLINVDLELKVNQAFSLVAKRLIANQMGFIAKTNVSKSKWSFSLIRKALLCIQDIVNTSTVHRPPIHLMSCFDASLDTRDSELLPCSCSASWKLHSMAINVLGSSEEEKITQIFFSPTCAWRRWLTFKINSFNVETWW